MRITVRVPASSANLGSGVDTLGMAVNLYLACTFEPAAVPAFTFGRGFDAPLSDSDNLVLTSARALFAEAGVPFPALAIHMDSDIPLARGLGSSSSAIIAGLFGASRFLPEPWAEADLLALAAKIEGHPDNVVPAALGGFTLAMMQRDRLFTRRFDAPDVRFAAVIPGYRLSTEKARQALPKAVPMADAVAQLQRAVFLSHALAEGDLSALALLTEDSLFTPARAPLMPGSAEARKAAADAGALCAWVSGAGPTVLAPVTGDAEAAARAMREAYTALGLPARTLILAPDNAGAVVTEE